MTRSLASHLATLDHRQLEDLLSRRPDALTEPAPGSMAELAQRLLQRDSIGATLAELELPQLQVAEAAAALGDECTRARLSGLLGVRENDPDLEAALARLTSVAVLWPSGHGYAGAHLRTVWEDPLGLGPSARVLLNERVTPEVRQIAATLGVTVRGGTKMAAVTALTDWFAEGDNVRRLVAEAPANVRTELVRTAHRLARPFAIMLGDESEPSTWALERGLIFRQSWFGSTMPSEVMLALRDGKQAPFDPRPPALTSTAADTEAVEREAAASATTLLAALAAVAEELAAKPAAMLKNGGVGTRELRRLAKNTGLSDDDTRLAFELLASAGLTHDVPGAAALSEASYGEFAAAEPAAQLLGLVDVWLDMPASPFAPVESAEPALFWDQEEEALLTALRTAVLSLLSDRIASGRATRVDELADAMTWYRPLIADAAMSDLDRFLTGIWREAHRVGLLAHGSPTRLCRLVIAGDGDAYGQAATMTPQRSDTVVIQADLTAVVTGTPSPALRSLLDAAADRESRGGAWTWRFSAASVRSGLDSGLTAAELNARLTAAARGGQVPQALTYLIADVDRQYGQVQVRAAGSCLTSDDAALLAEIQAVRSLRKLGLVQVAPTVLISAEDSATTLAALRAAGYAPSELGRVDRSPAPMPRDGEPEFIDLDFAEPAQLARKLLRTAEN